RRVLRPRRPAHVGLPRHGSADRARTRAAARPRGRRAARRLRPHPLLAADGHAARVPVAERALGRRNRALEDVVTQDELRRAYAGKRVLVTGHTGFKGGWLTLWLADLGADVTGYALAPDTPSLFEAA